MNKNSFFRDLRQGQSIEEEVFYVLKNKYRGYFYDFVHDKMAKEKGYDIKAKCDILDAPIDVYFEVKHDKKSDKSGYVAIEYKFNNKPSGISTTTSHFYVYKLNNNFYIISVKKLKDLLKNDKSFITDKKIGGDNGLSNLVRIEKSRFISVCTKINV